MPAPKHETSYTHAVKQLLNRIDAGHAEADDLRCDAVQYFLGEHCQPRHQQQRLKKALSVCDQLIALTEGNEQSDTLEKSAKFLGTVLLLSPAEGPRLSLLHQRLKPAYKAVLSLRLLDRLMSRKRVKSKYLVSHYNVEKRYSEAHSPYHKTMVNYPFLFASLFQDIGMQHPEAQAILRGEDGKADPFRVLGEEDRKQLLTLTFKHSLDYVENGLGIPLNETAQPTDGKEPDNLHEQALAFTQSILADTLQSKLGIGEIIKVPQIYASVILSTKQNYTLADLPKATLLLDKLAEDKRLNRSLVEQFNQLVGKFPQGFGIAYIPNEPGNSLQDRYEYAVVNELCPDDPTMPRCRVVTKNRTFFTAGQNITVNQSHNMYYPEARKKLEMMSAQRADDVLQKLRHDFAAGEKGSLLPTHWSAHDFFMQKANQNLWNKA